jgi:hypothetical protein
MRSMDIFFASLAFTVIKANDKLSPSGKQDFILPMQYPLLGSNSLLI